MAVTIDMSEIAKRRKLCTSVQSEPAISEHAQEHAPPFRAAVLDKIVRTEDVSALGLEGFEHLGSQPGLLRMRNSNGVELILTPFGLTTVKLVVPASDGTPTPIVLGFNSFKEYQEDGTYQGRTIGQVANRIGNGKFKHPVTNQWVVLDQNDSGNCLHGGNPLNGWSNQLWYTKGEPVTGEFGGRVTYFLLSDDRQSGFPGPVYAEVTVTLTPDNRVVREYRAMSKRLTPVSMTDHSYYNLNGVGSNSTVHNHILTTNAAHYLVNAGLIPTGEIASVQETKFDFFNDTKEIGKDFGEEGYDNHLVFPNPSEARWVVVESPRTGIGMELKTDQQGCQIYTGFFLNGKPARQFGAFCLEPGMLNDAVNHPEWLDAGYRDPFIRQGKGYKARIECRFFVREQTKG